MVTGGGEGTCDSNEIEELSQSKPVDAQSVKCLVVVFRKL
jgi:hypothetical protein